MEWYFICCIIVYYYYFKLNLQKKKNIQGTLPSELALFDDLHKLDLGKNNLFGTLPDSWGALVKSVVQLSLHDNSLTGTIPASWGDAANLREFDISNNQLSGVWPSGLVPSEECRTAGNGQFTNCPAICCVEEESSCDCDNVQDESNSNSENNENNMDSDEKDSNLMEGFVRRGVGTNYGLIIGGILGGLCCIGAVGGFIFIMTRKTDNHQANARPTTTGASSSRSFNSASSDPKSEYGIVQFSSQPTDYCKISFFFSFFFPIELF